MKNKLLAFTLILVFIAAMMAGCSGNAPKEARSITLSTTTSANDSGLLDYLAPYLKDDTGISLDILAQGSISSCRPVSALTYTIYSLPYSFAHLNS